MAYTKLFSSIVASTVWAQDAPTKIVWITLLALADKDGEIMGSVPGLAHLARVSVDECEVALQKFMHPDPYSRTLTAEGRRIEKIDGGWLLINHSKYRRMASKDDVKERNAERQARFRNRHRDSNASNASVTQERDIAEADTDSDTEKNLKKDHSARKPRADGGSRLTDDWQLTDELRGFASDLGLEPQQARDEFVDYWTSVPGSKGRKLDWGKTFKNRCRELGKKPRQPIRGEDWNQRRIREAKEAVK